MEELARIAASRVRDAVGHDNTEPVFAVTHSMGAVVLRHMQLLPTDERPRWCVPLVASLCCAVLWGPERDTGALLDTRYLSMLPTVS